jgi:hypothetical protein
MSDIRTDEELVETLLMSLFTDTIVVFMLGNSLARSNIGPSTRSCRTSCSPK